MSNEQLSTFFQGIADAIRTVTGETDTMTPSEFSTKITNKMQVAQPSIPTDLLSESLITNIKFSKTDVDADYEDVTLPHTCNVNDCTSPTVYRGKGYYKIEYDVTSSDLEYVHYLKLEQTTMCSEIYLNGTKLFYHSSGYTPCTVRLDGLVLGTNIIKIVCDNSINYDIIPLSADFTFPNGIIGLGYIMKGKGLFIDPIEYGIDRAHITQVDISSENAKFDIDLAIRNENNDTNANPTIVVDLIKKESEYSPILVENTDDVDPEMIYDGLIVFVLSENSFYKYIRESSEWVNANEYMETFIHHLTNKKIQCDPSNITFYHEQFNLENPHLWQGKEDPYLYFLLIRLVYNGKLIDIINIPTGFRKIEATHDGGIKLNGVPIRLWGAAVHQDCAENFAAMTRGNYIDNYELFEDIGMNYIRLAHYPHNVFEYLLADIFGILTEVEIPWINNCPLNCSEEYKESIMQYVKDMIVNLYNHPCIALWGVSNELGGNHKPIPNNALGGYSKELAVELNNKAYFLARKYDKTRPIGFQAMANTVCLDFIGDWAAFNTYDMWYTNNQNDQTTVYNQLHGYYKYIDGISEYGAGANVLQQSEDWKTLEEKGSYGNKHYESYQSWVHEMQINKIIPLTSMGICSLWVFFDFPAYPRAEGGSVGLNNKGLVTRDRSVKKDVYYLYKALWNKGEDNSVVYIKDRRLSERTTSEITITVYSNCDSLKLYQNDIFKQELTGPTDTINNIIWKFDPVQFFNQTDEFKVEGYINEELSDTDIVSFTTSSTDYINRGDFIDAESDSVKLLKNNSSINIDINASGQFSCETTDDWITISNSEFTTEDNSTISSTLTVNVSENTTSSNRTGHISISLNDNSDIIETITVLQKNNNIEELPYIKAASMSEYINTGYIPNANTSIKAKFFINNASGSSQLFGSRTSSTFGDRFGMYYAGNQISSQSYVYLNGSHSTGNVPYAIPNDDIYEIEANNEGITINGVLKSFDITEDNPYSFTTSTLPLYILATNQNGSLFMHANIDTRLYYFKIYEGETLVHDFIPAINSTTNKIALYDNVEEEFITSNTDTLLSDGYIPPNITLSKISKTATYQSGTDQVNLSLTGTFDGNPTIELDEVYDWITLEVSNNYKSFTVSYNENTGTDTRSAVVNINYKNINKSYTLTQAAQSVVLPEYTELECLRSPAIENPPYILTNIKPSTLTYKIEIKGSMSKDSCALFGARSGVQNKRFDFMRNINNEAMFNVISASPSLLFASEYIIGPETHTYILKANEPMIVDDNTAETNGNTTQHFECDVPLMLFADNTNGVVSNNSGVRTINYCKIYDGDTLVAHFIPVLDSDNIPCMYDIIGSTYYYSKTSNSFEYDTITV